MTATNTTLPSLINNIHLKLCIFHLRQQQLQLVLLVQKILSAKSP
ncbi:hypothetical protein DOY81_008337 [Sarcophaga bullata]|nr:hypothetical protein DOY81_008337 [Sarcophaga bullata]